jgi:hypothetical protein
MNPNMRLFRARQIAKMSHYCCEVRFCDDGDDGLIISMCGLGFEIMLDSAKWVEEGILDDKPVSGWVLWGMSSDGEWKLNNQRYESFDMACVDAIKALRDYDFMQSVGVEL